MSKSSQEAKDLRQAEAAQEQVRESDIRELVPESGSPEATAAEDARAKLKKVAELKELPSFDEAMAEVGTVAQSDNTAADILSHRYGSKKMKYVKRIPTAHDGEAGWHCVGREDGPLSPDQSQRLADAINEKIDAKKMKETTARNKARNERKKAKRQAAQARKADAPQKEVSKEITNEDILSAIPRTKNRNELGRVLAYCEKIGKCETSKDEERGVMVVLPIGEDNVQLAEAFNNQYDAIAERAKEKEFERHVKWAVGKMKEAKSTPHLETIIRRNLGHMAVIKKGKGRYNWTVHLKEGAPETYKRVVEEATRIKKEVSEKARQEADLRKAREDIESLLRRVRR